MISPICAFRLIVLIQQTSIFYGFKVEQASMNPNEKSPYPFCLDFEVPPEQKSLFIYTNSDEFAHVVVGYWR